MKKKTIIIVITLFVTKNGVLGFWGCERENVTPVACLTVSRLAVLDNNVCRGGRLSVSRLGLALFFNCSDFSSYNLGNLLTGRGTGDTQHTLA